MTDLTLLIDPDLEPFDPRTEYDNLGTMVCFHRNYNLGDKTDLRQGDFDSWEEVEQHLREEEDARVVLPLFLMDHSGLTIRTDSGPFRMADSHGWDWGQVGLIYVTTEQILAEYGAIDAETLDTARSCLIGEVDTYDQYLRGDVYEVTINTPDGEVLESLCGLFGREYAEEEGQRMLTDAQEEWDKREVTREAYIAWARDFVFVNHVEDEIAVYDDAKVINLNDADDDSGVWVEAYIWIPKEA